MGNIFCKGSVLKVKEEILLTKQTIYK
jgi:hypothetical protein